MSEERQNRNRSPKGKPKKNRDTVNIEFARGLSSEQLNTILQLELIRARGQKPAAQEVTLPTEIIHDIKFRLRYYAKLHGEVDRKKFFEEKDESDEEDVE